MTLQCCKLSKTQQKNQIKSQKINNLFRLEVKMSSSIFPRHDTALFSFIIHSIIHFFLQMHSSFLYFEISGETVLIFYQRCQVSQIALSISSELCLCDSPSHNIENQFQSSSLSHSSFKTLSSNKLFLSDERDNFKDIFESCASASEIVVNVWQMRKKS